MINQEIIQKSPYSSFERPFAVIASSLCSDGYYLAKQYAEHGYDLLVAAGNPSVVEEAEDLKASGVDAVSFQLDLSTTEGIEQLYKKVVAAGRPVDVLIINSGISTDLTNEIELAAKVLRDMENYSGGRILFVGKDEENLQDIMNAIKEIQKMVKDENVLIDTIKPGETNIHFSNVKKALIH